MCPLLVFSDLAVSHIHIFNETVVGKNCRSLESSLYNFKIIPTQSLQPLQITTCICFNVRVRQFRTQFPGEKYWFNVHSEKKLWDQELKLVFLLLTQSSGIYIKISL